MKSEYEQLLESKMQSLGYTYHDGTLTANEMPGFASACFMGHFRSAVSAANYLVAVTRNDSLREMVSGL